LCDSITPTQRPLRSNRPIPSWNDKPTNAWMTCPTTKDDASRLHALANAASAQLNGEAGESCVPSPESKALWTNGQPDHAAIKKRMEETLQAYLQKRPPPLDSTPYRHLNQLSFIKKAQAEFYSEMHYLDDLLHAIPELPLQVESTTTIVPYQPAQSRRRGRPSTGGRKPKPTTRKGRRKETD